MELKYKLRYRGNVKVKKNGCWHWTGPKDHKGYGRFCQNGRGAPAHRILYELKFGKILPGKELHHHCRNRACVNPFHLAAVSHEENMRYAAKAGAWRGEKNSNAKLDEEQVVAIRFLYLFGISPKRLSESYNISPRLVYHIIRGEAWRHVKELSAL